VNGENQMHNNYQDILENIDKEPSWFDENAVPRFCSFSTSALANIYAQEAALVLIKCQACETEFKVAFSELNMKEKLWDGLDKVCNISDFILDKTLHYGDPPNIECCAAGPTMGSVAIRVLEYWYKPVIRGEGVKDRRVIDVNALNFKRDIKLEISLK